MLDSLKLYVSAVFTAIAAGESSWGWVTFFALMFVIAAIELVIEEFKGDEDED